MPTTPGITQQLPWAVAEANAVAARLPGAIQLTDPGTGPEDAALLPTRPNVLELVRRCAIAHFACHGWADPADPSQSLLLLHDHQTRPLTVAAMTALHLEHAQLAYLSACETALATAGNLLDESIHLASAFQLAGYPHVIGTLWTINDHVAARIADSFYDTLARGDGSLDASDAARALHRVIRAQRDRRPEAPSLWAAYLHAGA